MKKLIIKYILFVSSFMYNFGISQNLVINSSFEIYQECPDITNINLIPLPWLSPTNNDVDFFHVCSDYKGVPKHGLGFQYAKTGDGYVGIWFYNGPPNYREYIQIKLLNILESDKCYYVEFNINLQSGLKYAVKNASLHFSNTQINSTGTGFVMELEPHISWFRDDYITDTVNWTKISGIYTATGGEEYITIGNFFNDVETDTLFTGFGTYHGAYYYIDDISVIPIDSLPNVMPAYAGEDKQVLAGDSIFIGQEISNLNCTWRTLDGTVIGTNTSGIYVQPSETTSYVVEQNLCGVVTYVTVEVSVGYVGLESEKKSDKGVNIYPNPSNGEFYISISENSSKNQLLEILDMSGKLIYSDNIQFENVSLKLIRNLESGIYVFKLTDEESKEEVLKKVTISNTK